MSSETSLDELFSLLRETNNLEVYLRIKPVENGNFSDLYEIINDDSLLSKPPEDCVLLRNGSSMNNKFIFSKIFPSDSTQEEVFNEIVKIKLLKLMNGKNSTLMTYGVSGSGKTYTIVGTPESPGILPRSLEYLFQTLPNASKHPGIKPLSNGVVVRLDQKEMKEAVETKEHILKNFPDQVHVRTYCAMKDRLSEHLNTIVDQSDVTCAVWVSFAEIYNEHIYDLFQLNKRDKLKLGQFGKNQSDVYIKNLTSIHVSSGLEAYQLLQFGLTKLNKASTNLNVNSSRSHAIFKVTLAQLRNVNGKDEYRVSHFNFCDLAGAERSKKTNNNGLRLVESKNINTSLLVLGRCIKGVREAQKNSDTKIIPFRESKLTQLFQRALSGNEDISMMVTINPERYVFEETQHVLNFSSIAKEIVIPKIEDDLKNNNDAAKDLEEKELKMQYLGEQIQRYSMMIEEEEINQNHEILQMKERLEESFRKQKSENIKKSEEEYEFRKLEIKQKMRNELKEAKKKALESYDDSILPFLSSESENSSDDEDDYQLMPRKKCRSDAGVSTIVIDDSSSDEESVDFWKIKFEDQTRNIEEHHDIIKKLTEKVVEMEEKILSQKKTIEELKSVHNVVN